MCSDTNRAYGFEQFALDHVRGLAFSGTDTDRFYMETYTPSSAAPDSGSVFAYHFTTRTLARCDLVGYPFRHFHPHGLSLLKGSDGGNDKVPVCGNVCNCVCVCMYVYMYVCMFVGVYVGMYACMYVSHA